MQRSAMSPSNPTIPAIAVECRRPPVANFSGMSKRAPAGPGLFFDRLQSRELAREDLSAKRALTTSKTQHAMKFIWQTSKVHAIAEALSAAG
jgi:hypothetical protein